MDRNCVGYKWRLCVHCLGLGNAMRNNELTDCILPCQVTLDLINMNEFQ
jgi:hypothetical protein